MLYMLHNIHIFCAEQLSEQVYGQCIRVVARIAVIHWFVLVFLATAEEVFSAFV